MTIVYRLKEPFKSYSNDTECDQWYEFGRGLENIDWIKEIRQVSDNEGECYAISDNKERYY